MTSKLVSHDNNRAVFERVVTWDRFNEELQQAYLKNRASFNIPGFRKGKAPRKIIEANYGKEIFYGDALDKLMQDAYIESVKELELDPIGTPEGDFEEIEDGKDITFKFSVDTMPIPEVGDYSQIDIEKFETELTDEEVDAFIEEERRKNRVIKNVEDREAKAGDLSKIDFEGFVDGETFEGGSATDYSLELGSGSFIPGFEEQLIGKKVGDELDVEVNFPEDYHVEELKGKPATFKVKINALEEEILPDLDDDFVMDVSEFDTLDEYKEDVRNKLQEKKDEQNRIELENRVLEKLIMDNDIPAPKSMVDARIDQKVHEYGHNIEQMGFTLESFMQMTQATEEDIRDQFREEATKQVQAQLLLDAIVEKEDVAVSEEEIEEEYQTIAKQYNQEGNEEFIKTVKASLTEDYIKELVSKRKILDKLIENVNYVEPKEVEEEEESEEQPEA